MNALCGRHKVSMDMGPNGKARHPTPESLRKRDSLLPCSISTPTPPPMVSLLYTLALPTPPAHSIALYPCPPCGPTLYPPAGALNR